MIEWIAIAMGAVSLLLSLLNRRDRCRDRRKEYRRRRKQATWEEYKETIYDPLRQELVNFQKQAMTCRRALGDSRVETNLNTFFRELSEAMNEIKNACAKADKHKESDRSDWEDFAEKEEQKIHSWEQMYREHNDPESHLRDFDHLYRSYVENIENRLREQRGSMEDS